MEASSAWSLPAHLKLPMGFSDLHLAAVVIQVDVVYCNLRGLCDSAIEAYVT